MLRDPSLSLFSFCLFPTPLCQNGPSAVGPSSNGWTGVVWQESPLERLFVEKLAKMGGMRKETEEDNRELLAKFEEVVCEMRAVSVY